MEVSIYIKTDMRGQKGRGKAAGIVEFISADGTSHCRNRTVEEEGTKNNLFLVIISAMLKLLLKQCNVNIYLDNSYVTSAIERDWMDAWQKNDWKKSNGKPVKNKKEWQQLYMLTKMHKVHCEAYRDKYDAELDKLLKEEA